MTQETLGALFFVKSFEELIKEEYSDEEEEEGSVPQKLQHRLGARLDVELSVDGVQVNAHRPGADAEFPSDLLVVEAVGKQRQNFMFARGERRHFRRGRFHRVEIADDLAGDGGGHRGAAGGHFPYRGEDLLRRRALEQVAARAGAQ